LTSLQNWTPIKFGSPTPPNIHRLDAFVQWLAARGVYRSGQISLELQNEYASCILSEIGNTQQDHINSLRRIFSCSDITVFEKIHARRHKSVSHDIFDEKEIALLLKTTDGWIRDIFVTGLYSGLRKKRYLPAGKSSN